MPAEKAYQVWHTLQNPRMAEAPPEFPKDYKWVATVQADGLRHAVEQTTHVNHPWQENLGVHGKEGARSTDIGDVVIAPDSKAYRFEGASFLPLDEREPTKEARGQTMEEVAEEERVGRLEDHQREERMYFRDYDRWEREYGDRPTSPTPDIEMEK